MAQKQSLMRLWHVFFTTGAVCIMQVSNGKYSDTLERSMNTASFSITRSKFVIKMDPLFEKYVLHKSFLKVFIYES